MPYEWDEAKNQANIRKHGVSFEEARTVFDDEDIQIGEDEASIGERRFIAIGFSKRNRRLFVVFCERDREDQEVIRIISARKLTPKDRKRLGWL